MSKPSRSLIKVLLFVLTVFVFLPGETFAKEIYQEVMVKRGQTLWDISNKYLKDPKKWVDIVKHNDLRTSDPTLPLPGTKLKVPIILIKEKYLSAHLVKMIPEVRYKRKGQAEWKKAKKDLTLKYEDSLRTMKGASAHVRFPTKELVQIDENTYVVLKPEKILQQIELLKGQVRASQAKVIMPKGTVVNPKGRKSDYHAKIRDDETEVVFVYKGKVDVTARGKTVTVPEGYGTEVPKRSPPRAPQPLTSFRDFDPSQLTQIAAKKAINPAKVFMKPKPKLPKNGKFKPKSKSLQSNEILVSYTVQISNDELFRSLAYEKVKRMGTLFDIKKLNIPDGKYFMKVAFTDALGITGPFSEPSIIIKDTIPPKISRVTPKEGAPFKSQDGFADVRGKVEGATTLTVNDEIVFISPEGKFSKYVSLHEGKNVINITAQDVNGNETTVERTIVFSKDDRN